MTYDDDLLNDEDFDDGEAVPADEYLKRLRDGTADFEPHPSMDAEDQAYRQAMIDFHNINKDS